MMYIVLSVFDLFHLYFFFLLCINQNKKNSVKNSHKIYTMLQQNQQNILNKQDF